MPRTERTTDWVFSFQRRITPLSLSWRQTPLQAIHLGTRGGVCQVVCKLPGASQGEKGSPIIAVTSISEPWYNRESCNASE